MSSKRGPIAFDNEKFKLNCEYPDTLTILSQWVQDNNYGGCAHLEYDNEVHEYVHVEKPIPSCRNSMGMPSASELDEFKSAKLPALYCIVKFVFNSIGNRMSPATIMPAFKMLYNNQGDVYPDFIRVHNHTLHTTSYYAIYPTQEAWDLFLHRESFDPTILLQEFFSPQTFYIGHGKRVWDDRLVQRIPTSKREFEMATPIAFARVRVEPGNVEPPPLLGFEEKEVSFVESQTVTLKLPLSHLESNMKPLMSVLAQGCPSIFVDFPSVDT